MVQKAHLVLNHKKEEIEKAWESLHTIVQRVYQNTTGEDTENPMEEKLKKVGDTISQLQA